MYKIIIGADLVPTAENEKYFRNGAIENIVDENVINKLKTADFVIANLEAPICTSNDKIIKNGPNLKIHPDCIKGISLLNPYYFTLANNHIMDYGEAGLNETIKILKKNGIEFSGCGNSLNEARKPYIIETKVGKIGLISCSEKEFSIAGEHLSGVNPFDLYDTTTDIKKLKETVKFVVVLYHGGKEHYRYPSPELKRRFHIMAENGADLVIAQHTHCIGCVENYNDSVLVYGQGNFVFDGQDNEYWNSGLLMEIKFDNSDKFYVDFYPLVKKEHKIFAANDNEKKEIMRQFESRSKKIYDNEFLEAEYRKLANRTLRYYQYAFGGILTSNFVFRGINKITKGWLQRHIYNRNTSVALLNYVECEAHQELLIAALRDKINEKDNR